MPETIQKCLTCGGELQANARTGIPTCIYCGRAYRNAVDSYSGKLSEITNRRQVREFIKAEELCRILLEEQPESSEANWQALLSSLGVVYVKERETGASKPTFFSYTYDERTSVLQNSYYKNAVRFAPTEEDRKYYEEKGEELDALLKEFFELVAKENSYDIFISFKKSEQVTAADGEVRTVDTDDYEKAREIYERLKGKYRVFFSPESIGKDTGIEGEKYEPRILKALQTAQAMILLGSKKEYLEAQWVENEWKRYLYFMDKGLKAKNSLIYVYHRNFPILPAALAEKQLPSVDMFKGDMFSRIEEKLGFVKSGKGLSSKIKKRTVQTDFTGESGGFEYGGTRERVIIGAKGGSEIQISAGEERALQSARDYRRNSSFKEARMEYENVLHINQNNAEAHWGRFACMVKCASDNKLPKVIFKTKDIPYGEFHRAIECSNNEEFSWACVDAMLACLDASEKWKKIQPLYDEILKYLDDKRVEKALRSLVRRCCSNAAENPKESETVFVQARRLFFKENTKLCLEMMWDYAKTLQEYGHYDLARTYYEELATAKKDGAFYLYLLQCRLHTADIENILFSLDEMPGEDAAQKQPSELSLSEIMERIVICDYKKQNSSAMSTLERIVKYQVSYNKKAAKPFVETVVGALDGLGEEAKVRVFLMELAEMCVSERDYKNAEIYFKEYLVRDEKSAPAHWGLLKCHMKADSDMELMKRRKKLFVMQDFQNAKNCADDAQYQYYMSVQDGSCQAVKDAMGLMREMKWRRMGKGVEIIGGVKRALSFVSDFTVPSHIQGKRVVRIGNEAFAGCEALRSVVIPDTVNSVGFHAFSKCNQLQSVTIPDSVKSIEDGAFDECKALTVVNIPESMKVFGRKVFSSCKELTTVRVGNSYVALADLERHMSKAGEKNRSDETKARKHYVTGRKIRLCFSFFPSLAAVLIGFRLFFKFDGVSLVEKIRVKGMPLPIVPTIILYALLCILVLVRVLYLRRGIHSETYESYVKQNNRKYRRSPVIVALVSIAVLILSFTVTHMLTKNKVSLKFENADGSVTTEYTEQGEAIQLPAQTKENDSRDNYIIKYVFEGWMIDGKLYEEGQWYTPQHDVSAVAKFSEEEWCTLNFSEDYAKITYSFSYANFTDEELKAQWNEDKTLPRGTQVTVSASFSYSDESGQSFSVNGTSVSNPYTFTLNENTTVSASSRDTSCLAEGTQIMLADGTTKAVEDLQMGDILLVFNHETGRYETSPLLVNVHANEEAAYRDVIRLSFSDGETLRIVGEHGLFDRDLNRYVYINAENAGSFVGHRFVSVAYENGEVVSKTAVLDAVTVTNELIRVYNPASVWHINLVADRMLTLSAGMVNLFAYDENMKYDEALMAADIAEWGLYTYDDFRDYVSVEVFNAFPFKYYKVAVGKGEITFEDLLWLIGFYHDPASVK